MKRKIFVFLLVALVTTVFAASEVLAECPEGKNPVQITTPSGKSKTLCIPDSAVQGIENAAEHSGGTIVASSCPCWTSQDIDDIATANPDFTCFETENYVKCVSDGNHNTFEYDFALKISGETYTDSVCINQVTGIIEYIPMEEVDACKVHLAPYSVIYTPPSPK